MKTAAFLLGLLLLAASAARGAEDGGAILASRCANCHDLKGPAPSTLKGLWARKGPDLFYAGNKYRQEWLAAWLRKPQRIRPAGEFYEDHIKVGAKSDEIDPATLADHPALDGDEAAAVAAALMRLAPNAALIEAEKIEPGTLSKSMGEMVFDKFLGCLACHQVEAGYGGLSGPELYTASRRLQPQFIASYVRNPQAWDPKIWMPNKHVTDANIVKLVRYLEGLGKESGDAK
jgi:mono/diheme cytochrome c family protein